MSTHELTALLGPQLPLTGIIEVRPVKDWVVNLLRRVGIGAQPICQCGSKLTLVELHYMVKGKRQRQVALVCLREAELVDKISQRSTHR